jgi:hypothetical protein
MDPIKVVELAEELAPGATKLAEETSARLWQCVNIAPPAAEAELLRIGGGGPSLEAPLCAPTLATLQKIFQVTPRFNPYLYSKEFTDRFADLTRAPQAGAAWDKCTGFDFRPEEVSSLATRLGKDVNLKLPEVL